MLFSKRLVKDLPERIRPPLDFLADPHSNQPNCDFKLCLICQDRLNSFKRFPHNPSQHTTSSKCTRR